MLTKFNKFVYFYSVTCLLLFAFSVRAYSPNDDFSSPITTKANRVFYTGALLTTTVFIYRNEISKPLQRSLIKHRPLVHYNYWGEFAGHLYPNAIYILGQSFIGEKDRALGMLRATLYSSFVVVNLKHTFKIGRPNYETKLDSFPSGHTTTAFAFAGFVSAEHGPLYGILANVMATFTALSRMTDNRHWFHDVLAGATIGVSYGLGINYVQKQSTLDLSFIPNYSHDYKSVSVELTF
ncbi:MAG: phosphatase PAP2 family protein [Bacteriovoracaceae bacterium]